MNETNLVYKKEMLEVISVIKNPWQWIDRKCTFKKGTIYHKNKYLNEKDLDGTENIRCLGIKLIKRCN